MTSVDFDAAIIGGGPAGSAMATYLARAGHRVCILESTPFPRPHVGESLVHACNRVLRDLGVIDQMDAHGFPRKYGAQWTAASDQPIYAHDWSELSPYAPSASGDLGDATVAFGERKFDPLPYTWHVDRGEFDHMLLRHAASHGAIVREDARVQRVEFAPDGASQQVLYETARARHSVSARLVIDASGRKTLLGTQLGLRLKDPYFDQFALHSWFEDYERGDSAEDDYIKIHFLPITNSWVWQIPISKTVTSFGVVTQRKNFPRKREERDAFFWEAIRSRPDVHAKLRAAKQLRPLKEEGDYSYSMREFAGDGWLLIGDAARFVDPIFSSGVSIALHSAQFAHRDVLRAFEAGTFTKSAFASYETTMRRGCEIWYRFITLYYRLNVLFTWFVSKPSTREQILRILQGDVYDAREAPVLEEMAELIRDIESNPRHVLHKHLANMTGFALGGSTAARELSSGTP